MKYRDLARKIGYEETIDLMIGQLGMTESDARFILAIDTNKIEGDAVDNEGKVMEPIEESNA